MNLQLAEHTLHIVVVKLGDALDAFNAPELRGVLDGYLDQGVVHFVLDLSDTPMIDSAGFSVFVSLFKRTQMRGGSVRLVSPRHDGARRILSLTKFDRVFEMFDTAEAALRHA